MVRNKSSVVIEGKISLSPKTIENGQQTRMFPVNAQPDKFDDGDVMAGLTASTEAVTKHKAERSLQHRFIGLLESGLFVEGENLAGWGKLLLGTCEKTINLRPVDDVRLKFFHVEL